VCVRVCVRYCWGIGCRGLDSFQSDLLLGVCEQCVTTVMLLPHTHMKLQSQHAMTTRLTCDVVMTMADCCVCCSTTRQLLVFLPPISEASGADVRRAQQNGSLTVPWAQLSVTGALAIGRPSRSPTGFWCPETCHGPQDLPTSTHKVNVNVLSYISPLRGMAAGLFPHVRLC